GVFHLLVNHLLGMDRDPLAATGGRAVSFRLKLLLAAGIAPHVGSCVVCGAAPPFRAFSPSLGGVLCSNCRERGAPLRPDSLAAIQGARAAPLAGAPCRELPVARQVDRLTVAIAEHHLGARLRPLPDSLLAAGSSPGEVPA